MVFVQGAASIAESTHEVTLDSFHMGITEITQKQWFDVMGASANPAEGAPTDLYGIGDTYPIYFVDWYDAVKFCNALSTLEKIAPYYDITGDANAATVTIVSPATQWLSFAYGGRVGVCD